MEEVNESSKLVAQAIELLKVGLLDDLPDPFDHNGNINEVIDLLEKVLEKLTK